MPVLAERLPSGRKDCHKDTFKEEITTQEIGSRISEDLSQLVHAGTITLEQAREMMPVKLTPDLQRMVEDGDVTREQAAKVMSATRSSATLVKHCGDMIAKGNMTGEEAGTILRQIQEEDQQKHIRDNKLRKEEDPILKTCWESRAEAIDCLKYHSTRQGKQVLVNRQSSCSKRIILMCASSLYRGKPIPASECVCHYRAVVRKTKKDGVDKPYRLATSTKKQHIQHSAMCTSTAHITYREAIKNLTLLEVQKLTTINQVRERIAKDNNVTQLSVSPFVAAKTRLAEAKQIFSDYFANWSKLDGWGEQLKERNPGSVVHVDVDKRNRFKRMFVGLRSAGWVAKNTGTWRW